MSLNLQGKRILFVGPAGAGKSTFIKRMLGDYEFKFLDVRDFVFKYAEIKGIDTQDIVGEKLLDVYKLMMEDLQQEDIQVLEIANDFPEMVLEQLCDAYFKDYEPRIVYVDSDFETSLKRVRQREVPTPEAVVRSHYGYDFGFYKKWVAEKGISIIKVSGISGFEREYEKVRKFVNS